MRSNRRGPQWAVQCSGELNAGAEISFPCDTAVRQTFFTFWIKFPVSSSALQAAGVFQVLVFNNFRKTLLFVKSKTKMFYNCIVKLRSRWQFFLRKYPQGRLEWQLSLFWTQKPSDSQHSSIRVWLGIDPRIVPETQIWSQHWSSASAVRTVWHKSLWNGRCIYLLLICCLFRAVVADLLELARIWWSKGGWFKSACLRCPWPNTLNPNCSQRGWQCLLQKQPPLVCKCVCAWVNYRPLQSTLG